MAKKGVKIKNISTNSFENTVLSLFKYRPHEAFNFRQVSAIVGFRDKDSRELIKQIISDLEQQGVIVAVKRGKYKLKPEPASGIDQPVVVGRVDMKQTGKAYIIVEGGGEDVYIAHNNTYQALHGDTVKVCLFPKRRSRKLEGKIVEVLKRNKTEFVGVIELSKNFAFFVADATNMPVDIFIPKEGINGAKAGEKVVVRIVQWPANLKNPVGEVVHVLGHSGENDVEMCSILSEYSFPLSFPDEVINEAAKISEQISSSEIKIRKDLRSIYTCTIDPEDSKDFDDALSIELMENGNYSIGIHIADVSYYVRPNTALDQDAYRRATSVYLVDRVIPMLPEKLSNEVCSLRPDEDKLAFSAIFEMNDKAEVISEWFGKTVIRSNKRYAYSQVQQMIDENGGENADLILKMNDLARELRGKRFKKGAINFKSNEVKFVLDEQGKPISAYIKEPIEANFLVEEFMLLANKRVAEFVNVKKTGKKIPTFIYRIHGEPNADKLLTFSNFLSRLGYKMNLSSRAGVAKSLNKLFVDIQGKGEENMISSIAIRTMAKAQYSTNNIGHYGLGFKYYSHFTSPIRRYPDLIAHRLFENILNDVSEGDMSIYEEQCEHASEMERKAIEAERASVKYKQMEFMLDKVGQVFPGIISGVSKWGLFIEIGVSKAEGLLTMENLDDDFYILDEENYQLVGKRYGGVFKLGDTINVRVKSIDLRKKQMNYTFP